MEWQTFYSLEKLIQKGRERADRCDVVSFDLFDTLFIRRIHDPDLVKLPVARYIAACATRIGIEISWQKVQKIRDANEQNQRKETELTFEDREACYPVFMEKSLQQIFADRYTDQLLDDVTSYELEMESSMLVPRAALVDWLAELHAGGKKIYILSDIYLPSRHLKTLARRGGFLHYTDEIVSSADSFLAKASGKAFPLVQERFGLDPSSWLHIGDNPFSDGLRPAQFGIQALVLNDVSEKQRKSLIKRYVNYSRGNIFYRGRALHQLMLPHEGENVPQPELYGEGYNFLGPLIGGFVQHIAEECRRLGITKVFFLSREGYTFKKV
ncbi:MAG: HAD family hydrolase, partial [Desulfocapsaceae bacterium]|nr:HAD family hydrolase [Desulfocapsaceae bacterium]